MIRPINLAKKYVVGYLNKAIDFGRAKILNAKDYLRWIFRACSHNSYIETVSNKADSLHRRIKLSYEEEIIAAYKQAIKKLLKYKRFGAVTLAVDVTKEEFYGEKRDFYIYHCSEDSESKAEFHYMAVSIVGADKNLPLMALPVPLGCDRVELVRELLLFAKSLLRIRLVLFDRGFVSAELIHALQELNLKYLIFARKYKSIRKLMEEVDDAKIIEYEMKYAKDKSVVRLKTNLVLIKANNDKEYDWCFYTNLHLDNAGYYIFLYKKRWQIETNFRVEDEAKIKSKSVNYLVRYFYFMLGLLLHAVWLMFADNQFKLFLIDTYEGIFLNEVLSGFRAS